MLRSLTALARPVRYPVSNVMADKLSASGVTYEALAGRLSRAEERVAELEAFKAKVEASRLLRWMIGWSSSVG